MSSFVRRPRVRLSSSSPRLLHDPPQSPDSPSPVSQLPIPAAAMGSRDFLPAIMRRRTPVHARAKFSSEDNMGFNFIEDVEEREQGSNFQPNSCSNDSTSEENGVIDCAKTELSTAEDQTPGQLVDFWLNGQGYFESTSTPSLTPALRISRESPSLERALMPSRNAVNSGNMSFVVTSFTAGMQDSEIQIPSRTSSLATQIIEKPSTRKRILAHTCIGKKAEEEEPEETPAAIVVRNFLNSPPLQQAPPDPYGSAKLSTKDKNPPLRILSFDGDILRGWSMLLLLEKIMFDSYCSVHGKAPDIQLFEEGYKPCDMFDIIVGSGPGGILALLFGRLRLAINQAKSAYHHICTTVFAEDSAGFSIRRPDVPSVRNDKFLATLDELAQQYADWDDSAHLVDPFEVEQEKLRNPFLNPSECPDGLEVFVPRRALSCSKSSRGNFSTTSINHGQRSRSQRRDSVRNRAASRLRKAKHLSMSTISVAESIDGMPQLYRNPARGGERLFDKRMGRCRTIVPVVYRNATPGQKPALLRSYTSPVEALIEPDITISEACAAAISPWLSSKDIVVGTTGFSDEGTGLYNPSLYALEEAVRLWPGRDIGCFVSLGTGISKAKYSWTRYDVSCKVKTRTEDCQRIHKVMPKALQEHKFDPNCYSRFNLEGPGKSDKSGFAEADAIGHVTASFHRYISKEDVAGAMKDCVRRIAGVQRDRIEKINAMHYGEAFAAMV